MKISNRKIVSLPSNDTLSFGIMRKNQTYLFLWVLFHFNIHADETLVITSISIVSQQRKNFPHSSKLKGNWNDFNTGRTK